MPVKMPAPGELEAVETASADELQTLQLQRLRQSLQLAYDQVVHFRQAFQEPGGRDCQRG